MTTYRQVKRLKVTGGLTACTLGSDLGTMLQHKYVKTSFLTLLSSPLHSLNVNVMLSNIIFLWILQFLIDHH